MRVQAAGAELVRHGEFVGVLNAARVPPELWAALERHEPLLRRMLPDLPTPWEQRQARGLTGGRAEP